MFARILLVPLTLFTLSRAFTFTVTVGIDETNGKAGLGFDPSTINPVAGDTITFTFQLPEYIKNPNSTQHSATQSSFDSPCTPKSGGFDTGIQSTGSANSNTGSTYNLLVNDTQSLWFFSSANADCNSGMLLAVNPPTSGDQTAQAFRDKAKTAPLTPASSSSASESTSGSSSSTGPAPSTSPTSGAARDRVVGYLGLVVGVVSLVLVVGV